MELSEKTAWFSILTNLLLVGIKSFLAMISGSLAIQADAIHSLTDVVSSAVILVGIKISRRQARSFPYGLYKVENLVALGTSLLIFLAGYGILGDVFSKSLRVDPARIPLAAAGIALTILITWLFSRYELKKAEETSSPSLMADARHIWSDMLSSLAILVALLGSAAGLALDRYAALVVVVFIGRAAFSIFLNAVRVLLDASLDFASLNRIRELVESDPRVVAINELRGRNAGRYKFVELDLALWVKDLAKGHRVAEELKQRIREGLNNVDHVLIHYERQAKDHLVLGVPLDQDRRTVAEHFGQAAFFRLLSVRMQDGSVLADTILSNPYAREEKSRGLKVANWLLEKGLDVLIVRKELGDKGPGYALLNGEVEIRVVTEQEAESVLAAELATRRLSF